MLRKPNERKLFDRNGSGDGGRFARRGASGTRSHKKKSALEDLFDFISEGFKLDTDDGEDDDFEDYLFSDAYAFEEEEEEEEEDEIEEGEEETAGLRLEWDFAELADLF
ncbi:hypothetical protein Emag_003256 [Eimeria magna]